MHHLPKWHCSFSKGLQKSNVNKWVLGDLHYSRKIVKKNKNPKQERLLVLLIWDSSTLLKEDQFFGGISISPEYTHSPQWIGSNVGIYWGVLDSTGPCKRTAELYSLVGEGRGRVEVLLLAFPESLVFLGSKHSPKYDSNSVYKVVKSPQMTGTWILAVLLIFNSFPRVKILILFSHLQIRCNK